MKKILTLLAVGLITVMSFAQSPFSTVKGLEYDKMDPHNYYYATVEVSYNGVNIYTSGEGVVAELFADLPFNMRESATKEWNNFLKVAEKNPMGTYSGISYLIDNDSNVIFLMKKWKVKLVTKGENIFSKMTYGR